MFDKANDTAFPVSAEVDSSGCGNFAPVTDTSCYCPACGKGVCKYIGVRAGNVEKS